MSIRRIASLAGVSPSTVSLALRGNPKIPEATRRRIVKLAQRIGYRPDAKVTQLMSQLRSTRQARDEGCFGVISFYDTARPWEGSPHLSRMYEAMTKRAADFGYRLEPLWLRAPGMTARRLRAILDARGIEGVLCFGSPEMDEPFPAEFDHYAIVTLGFSIRAGLHRIQANGFGDMWNTLEMTHRFGYRRPALAIGVHEDIRSGHTFAGAYYAWCQHKSPSPGRIPILRFRRIEENTLFTWLSSYHPDVLILADTPEILGEFSLALQHKGLRPPQDLGVAVVSHVLEGTDFSGMQINQGLMGGAAVEMLVDRITHRDFGLPTHPRIQLVGSQWISGKTLRLSLE